MTAARGPAGRASPPPDWLRTSSLPLLTLSPPATLVRIHRTGQSPIFFSPGPGARPLGRFDSASGRFGVLYSALSVAGAVAETILRNPQRRVVGMAVIETRAVAHLVVSRPVRLVRLHGAGLQTLGVDNAITTGPYEPCGRWADAVFSHADQPDGIAYASRHDPDHICVALFARADLSIIAAGDSVPLTALLAEMGAILRRYGKGLVL